VGAILTQNTAWSNVEKALQGLKQAGLLNLAALRAANVRTLARWVRPAGTFNIKAKRLKAFVTMVERRFDGRLSRLFALPTERLREELLNVKGIGPETADSILLYAGKRPVFVVDAYTRRFLRRHGWSDRQATYEAIARLFTERLPTDEGMYNEFHALIVALGKHHCRKAPKCQDCPLSPWLPPGGPRAD